MLNSTELLSATSFLTLGDWGGNALGSYHTTAVTAVASQMAKVASAADVQFVVNTGDNFYYCGIQNTSDFQIETDFTGPFGGHVSLNVPWYSVLGNHEYGYNVDAQIQLASSSLKPQWVMDDRYYTRRVSVGSAHVSFIFLDTSPCVSAYRSSKKSGWDPCGTEFPTCAPIDEGTCEFHSNILSQDCTKQFKWFEKALAAVPADDWLIVVGHHPADEINVEDFTSAMQKHGFDLYLNGHVHTLSQYKLDGDGAYVTSGAGAMVATQDQHSGEAQTKLAGGHVPKDGASGKHHSYSTVWNDKVAGFTRHTFSADYQKLTTDFVTYQGKVAHSFEVEHRSPRASISRVIEQSHS